MDTGLQELIELSDKLKYNNLSKDVLNNILHVASIFLSAVNIEEPYNVQMKKLLEKCEKSDVYFVNGDVFGDIDDTGLLRVTTHKVTPDTNQVIELLVDVCITPELHDKEKDDTEENTYIRCTGWVDVTVEIGDEEYNIRDINSLELAGYIFS